MCHLGVNFKIYLAMCDISINRGLSSRRLYSIRNSIHDKKIIISSDMLNFEGDEEESK